MKVLNSLFIFILILSGSLSSAQKKTEDKVDPFSLNRWPDKIESSEAVRREFFKSIADNRFFLETPSCSFRAYKSNTEGFVFEILEKNKVVSRILTNQKQTIIHTQDENVGSDKKNKILTQMIDNSVIQSTLNPKITRVLKININLRGEIEGVTISESYSYSALSFLTEKKDPISHQCLFLGNNQEPSDLPAPEQKSQKKVAPPGKISF